MVLPLEMVVVGGGVEVDTGEGVVVEAINVKNVIVIYIHVQYSYSLKDKSVSSR